MSHVRYNPLGSTSPYDITTTSDSVKQLWQELTMIRHRGAQGLYGKVVTAPFIDQAKIYYQDACKSHWKSAGLLYYYSFLNLAKAYIISRRAVSGNKMKSISSYHGLSARAQSPNDFIDFELEVHPPTSSGGTKNIFSLFFEKFTGQNWPFSQAITISIRDVISYSDEISHEIHTFHTISGSNFLLQGIIRLDNTHIWYEIVCPDGYVPVLQNNLGPAINLITPHANLSKADKDEWQLAYNKPVISFRGHSLVRINQLAYTEENKGRQFALLQHNIVDTFSKRVLPLPAFDFNTITFNSFKFVPYISIHGKNFGWHPFLSNYLISFALSTVLRYYPHMFKDGSKDSFLAEAWCNQSPVSSLRYFLMSFSNHKIRLD